MIITWKISNDNELIVMSESCCTTMKEVYKGEEFIIFGNPNNRLDRFVNLTYRVWEYDDYDYNVFPINWCPFCKAPIVIVEEYSEEDALHDAKMELQKAQASLKRRLETIKQNKKLIEDAENKIIATKTQYDKLLQQYKDKHET